MATGNNRPTSPHLQVYRLPLTGIISITHRMTGVFLSGGLVLFVGIVAAIATGSEIYDRLQAILQWWPVLVVYWGFVYALFFHLCHGIRHLFWDAGYGFDQERMNRYALIELAASLALTLITLIFV